MDKLAYQHAWEDIIQYALLLPDSNEVYSQARTIAKKEKMLWFDCKYAIPLHT